MVVWDQLNEIISEKQPFNISNRSSESSFKKLAKRLSGSETNCSKYLQNSNDINNNNSRNNHDDSDLIKAAKLLTKLKPGSSFCAIISSMVPFAILTRILKTENARLKGVEDDLEKKVSHFVNTLKIISYK